MHPADSGFQKMSDRWYPALTSAIGGTTPPDDRPPAGACTATYRVVSQWSDGFQGEVSVRNGASLAASATFGFLASSTGSTTPPAVTCATS